MKVNLCLFKKDGTVRMFTLPSTVTTIGRRRDCDMCIPLPSVSRRHCEFDMDNGRLHLRDLNSANGTFLNGARIEESPVRPGDELRIGGLNFRVQIDGVPENLFAPAASTVAAIPPPPDVEEDVDLAQNEEAFEDMLKGLSGLDLAQTLDPANHPDPAQQP